MTTLIIIVLASLVLAIIIEFASLTTYGWWIKEDILDKYFEKHLQTYKEGSKSGYLLHGSMLIPFIANCSDVTSKYYIDSLGRIPRWSKWTKELDKIVWEI